MGDEAKKLGPLGLRLIEGLSGGALRIAQASDVSELGKPTGAEFLLERLEKELRPKRSQQARELFAAGSFPHGPLSRQQGEPMSSYILRRRMWHQCPVDVSAEMRLPDAFLAEQLLLSANLGHDHQLMIRTAVHGELTYQNVADQLLAQRGKIHEREARLGVLLEPALGSAIVRTTTTRRKEANPGEEPATAPWTTTTTRMTARTSTTPPKRTMRRRTWTLSSSRSGSTSRKGSTSKIPTRPSTMRTVSKRKQKPSMPRKGAATSKGFDILSRST